MNTYALVRGTAIAIAATAMAVGPARAGQVQSRLPALRTAVPVVKAFGPSGSLPSGAGIVVGRQGSAIVLVTPRHVVAGEGAAASACTYPVSITMRASSASQEFASTRVRCHPNLDLAVVEAQAATDAGLDLLPRLVAARESALSAGYTVVLLGNPGEAAATNLTGHLAVTNDPKAPHEVTYSVEDGSTEAGYSGGAVLSADLQLLGMHIEGAGTRGFALRWSRIAAELKLWGVEMNLVDFALGDRSAEFTGFAADAREEAAQAAIRRYVVALRSGNAQAVADGWPSVPRRQLDALLGDARELHFDVRACGPLQLKNEAAGTITCEYQLELTDRAGRKQAVPSEAKRPLSFDLEGDPATGVWQLVSVR